MTKILLILLLSLSQLFGLTLQELITNALNKNQSLESISYKINASQFNINASDNFSNPTLSYIQNTLDNNQAMSKKTLTLTQKLPYFGKRDSLKSVASAEKNIIIANLSQAKVLLVESIKTIAYTIYEDEKLRDIIEDYENLTKQNIELFESYTSASDNQHMGIMSAELALSDLKIQKSVLDSKIESAYARLAYLTSVDVKNLDIKIELTHLASKTKLQNALLNNQNINIKDKEILKSKAQLKSAELNNYPDVNLIAGYSQRDNFDNFATFGIGLSLPIYSTEDDKEEHSRALVLSANSSKNDISQRVKYEFESHYAQMKSAYEIYHILHDDSLPQLEHMFSLTSSSIATGGDLFKYINILEKKLSLEQKSIMALANYKRAEAKISALIGELK